MASTPELKKTIAFVSNNAWSVFNFRRDVIQSLQNNNYQVLVLSPNDGYSQKLTAIGCTYIPVEFNNKGENPLKDLLFYRKLRKLYRRLKPDFIFHYVAKPNIYGSLAASAEGIPSVAVITGLGYPFARRNWLFGVIKGLYKKALKNTREVWFLNNEDAKVFVTEKIVNIHKVKVLPGEGVNTDHFSPFIITDRAMEDLAIPEVSPIPGSPPSETRHGRSSALGSAIREHPDGQEPFHFLMSTRLLRSKGVGLYADAARILRKKHYNVECNLIGFFEKDHPDSISADDLLQWQNEGLIRYHGFIDDVREQLNAADCFVFPSFYNEGVPRCLMEAASMELPIITSLNRGCREVVLNNSNGYVCNPNDPFDLADKMERMMNVTSEERSRMGKNGRQLMLKKFDMSKIIAEYTNTLISAFENHHGNNS